MHVHGLNLAVESVELDSGFAVSEEAAAGCDLTAPAEAVYHASAELVDVEGRWRVEGSVWLEFDETEAVAQEDDNYMLAHMMVVAAGVEAQREASTADFALALQLRLLPGSSSSCFQR